MQQRFTTEAGTGEESGANRVSREGAAGSTVLDTPVPVVPGAAPQHDSREERRRRLFVFSRGKKPEKPRPEFCLNCGLHVPSHHLYCGGCGQENIPSAVSVGTLVREVADEIIKIDAKLIKTLGILMFRPGHLTQEYIAGKRLRYLSPFKMYVTVSALFLIVFGYLVPTDRLNDKADSGPQAAVTSSPGRTVVDQTKRDPKTGAVRRVHTELTMEASAPKLTGGKGSVFGINEPFDVLGVEIDPAKLPASVTEYRQQQMKLRRPQRDTALARLLKEKIIRINKNPGDALRDLLTSMLPPMMLFLIPAYAVLLKLFYLRTRRLYVEHLVFTLHTHTFLFLILGPVLAAEAAAHYGYVPLPQELVLESSPLLVLSLIGTMVVYNIAALRRFYGQSVMKTLFKSGFLFQGYLLLLSLAMVLGALVAALVMFCTA